MKALITGITGQDGSYLAEFLLSKGYEVHGLIRRASTFNTHRIDHIYTDPHQKGTHLFLHYGDLSDAGLLTDLIFNLKPDEIYHLGAQSHVRVSFEMPEYTGNVTGLGTTRILEAIRHSGIKTRFYQASSSEMFGAAPPPQNEQTPFEPQSPYAISKVYGYWFSVNYRNAYNLFVSNGILFNHESPRRGEVFVTRKITRALAHILAGKQRRLYVGNLNAKRDWGFAPEYVEVMWKILQLGSGGDFVIGTGESHTVREFLEMSFSYAGVELEWKGSGIDEKGIVKSMKPARSALKAGDIVVEIDQKYFRPTEVNSLCADISKARKVLQWSPRVTFANLVKIMVDFDMMALGLETAKEGMIAVQKAGFTWTTHDFALAESIQNEPG